MIRREKENNRLRQRKRRARIRKKISGTAERPRLSVARTLKHVHVQLIDDLAGRTLVAASTATKGVEGKTKTEKARWAGQRVAALAKDKGITKAVFDRGGRKYHGRVKAVADGARAGGLEF